MKNLFFIIAFAVVYMAGSELSASRKAAKFCDLVSIGEPTEGLLEDAIDAGARRAATYWQSLDSGYRELPVTFTGFMPGSDFTCLILETNGRVAKKQAHLATSIFASIRKPKK